MPEIVVMKFRGDDAIRSGANQRFFDKGGFSLRSEDTDLIASTEDGVKLEMNRLLVTTTAKRSR